MRIAVFGATGGTGLQIVQQALDKDYDVTALVRSLAKMRIDDAGLRIVTGDVLDPQKVQATIEGADAVICSLGTTANNPDDLLEPATRSIIAAMHEAGIRRLIVISSMGVGDSIEQVGFMFRTLMKTVMKDAIEQKERQETAVRESNLDWTIIRPGGLTDGPYTGQYAAGTDPKIKAGQVSRADVASFVLEQLESDDYLHKTPVIT